MRRATRTPAINQARTSHAPLCRSPQKEANKQQREGLRSRTCPGMWLQCRSRCFRERHVGNWLRMPSSNNKSASGRATPAKIDHRDSLGMDDQLHKCPCSEWDPGPLVNKTHPGAKAGGPNKKKTRKHQRFMARRALEQKGLLKSGEKMLRVRVDPSETCTVQDSVHWKARRSNRWMKEEMGKAHENLGMFQPSPAIGTANQPSSSQDCPIEAPLSSSSSTCTDSLSCLTPKKPRKCVAIDCEMVGTGPSGKINELARCTVVNYDGDIIYDKYIQPVLPISDYRTRWSGVTPRHMEHATPFRVAQGEILQILRNKIVVGHALHNDFRVLKYFHPREWTRDTSKSPLLREKVGLSMKNSVSLKSLARELLHKKIQASKNGHSSVEDAQASMELYRLVEVQWEQELTSRFPSSPPDSGTDIDHYMDDQYWPDIDHYMDDQYWPKDLDEDYVESKCRKQLLGGNSHPSRSTSVNLVPLS